MATKLDLPLQLRKLELSTFFVMPGTFSMHFARNLNGDIVCLWFSSFSLLGFNCYFQLKSMFLMLQTFSSKTKSLNS